MAEICLRAGLPNVCKQYVKREAVVAAMESHHLMEIKKEMEPLKKLAKIKLMDTRRMQSYMKQKSLENSRTEFKWETNMIDTRINMKGKYEKDKYECPHCFVGSHPGGRTITSDHLSSQPGGRLETSDHLLVCSAYADLRQGVDPELVTEDRASYLRQVVRRRSKLEEQLRSRRQ